MVKLLCLAPFLLARLLAIGQLSNSEIVHYQTLGKGALIGMAIDEIKATCEMSGDDFSSFDSANYDIRVWRSQSEIKVVFETPQVMFFALGRNTIGDITIGLGDSKSSFQFHNQSEDPSASSQFYHTNPESKRHEALVLSAIESSDPVMELNLATFVGKLLIFEHVDHYAVSVTSDGQRSTFKIDKFSADIYDVQHRHIRVIAPLDEEFIEIMK